MKRIYACLCIVAVLLSIAFYSSWRVQKFAEDISDDIDNAVEALRDEDLPAARQALAEGAKLCDEIREGMNHLLRTQDFTELESALPRRRRPPRDECSRGSPRRTTPGTGSGGNSGMAFPEIRLIKSPRLIFISCNLRYLKFICPNPPRNKSYKPDFMQRVPEISIDSSFVFLY